MILPSCYSDFMIVLHWFQTPAPCCYDTGMYVLLALDPADETAGDAEEDDDLGEVSARPWSLKSAELSKEHRSNRAASVSEVP